MLRTAGSASLVIATAALAVVGCAPAVSSAAFLSPAPEPRPADHPVRFYAEARPQCPYEEVGTISARKRAGTMDDALDAIRTRVREMGGDAVIGVTQGQ